ncbi:hypothetical protein LKL54_15705, partial [Listeria monocytogenes ATCC 19115]
MMDLVVNHTCLLYTSDDADELDGLALGGRSTIKKKKYTHFLFPPFSHPSNSFSPSPTLLYY